MGRSGECGGGVALLNRCGVAAQRDVGPCIAALKARKLDASVRRARSRNWRGGTWAWR
ncbi:hypothetical protein [Burkholderia diffusa]|uniref:hypothetical protein n=1 Tax=Burkholderia diffusa TaxID=488732 RepID=UPI001F2D8715|nr:hypothetical protein [Burkholderia diffusa]